MFINYLTLSIKTTLDNYSKQRHFEFDKINNKKITSLEIINPYNNESLNGIEKCLTLENILISGFSNLSVAHEYLEKLPNLKKLSFIIV